MERRVLLHQGIPFPATGEYRRTVRFRVLGSIAVSEEGRDPISLGGPKQRAVLAHLLLRANHLVPTDLLIDEVWGEAPPDTARNALQSYVSHLRKALGAERLEGSRAGYVLRADPAEVDATLFQSLVRDARRLLPIDPRTAVGTFDRALELWCGPAFGDLASERSLRAEAVRLDELRVSALEDQVEARLALGEHAEITGDLEALTAECPLRERLWGQLMVALYRSGRQAEALAAYQRAREILAEELGVDPGPELRSLHEEILRQDPGLDLRGEPLRGYRLLERLGEGSFGTVYRATQPHVGREVAIRIVPERIAGDPAFVRRFESDAQAVATLEHPHAVPLYDYWHEPGRAYIVTRLLVGGSLRSRIEAGGPLPQEVAVRILEQIVSVIAAAHRRGVVHGDLRSSNVLFDEEDNTYVGDFRIGPGGGDRTEDLLAIGELAREVLGGAASSRIDDLVRRAAVATEPEEAAAILAELSTVFGSAPGAPIAATIARNPYKGLRPFLEADAADFQGREPLVRRLLERLSTDGRSGRFLAVVGPSGSGKSSVVSAGLVPQIRSGGLPGSDRWFVSEMHPGRHPFEELETALLRAAVRPPTDLLRSLESEPRGLLEASNAIVPDPAELMLVVDQLEEVFTLTEDEGERTAFLESLSVAAADPTSRVRVVVTLRADFYDRPLSYRRFSALLGSNTEIVGPLTPDQLERAIVRPAERAGLAVDGGLVAQISADVAEHPGALPLVQYALTELYERSRDGRLTLEAYRGIGGVAGALASSAEHLYRTRSEAGREAVRQLYLRLVTLGDGTADTRRRVPLSELDEIEVDPEAMSGALDAFGRHRLLTFDRDPATREPTVEVAHEALLGAWERLGEWIDEAREDVRTHRRLAVAATEWERSGRESSYLLGGSHLALFETWASSTSLAVARTDREFLRASVRRREEERSREGARRDRERSLERRSIKRLRALVAALTVGVLVAGTLTVVALDRNREAQRASRLAAARELAGSAISAVGSDPQLATLLALESIETTDRDAVVVPDAEKVLRLVTPSVAVRSLGTVQSSGGFLETSLTPDVGRVAIVAEDGPTAVWDLATGQPGRRVFVVPTEIRSASECPTGEVGSCDAVFRAGLSPDGALLATGHGDGSVRVWDLASGQVQLVVDLSTILDATVHRAIEVAPFVGFSPDGRYLWTQPPLAGRMQLRDPATGALVLQAPARLGASLACAANISFSAGGRWVAIGGMRGVTVWSLGTRERILADNTAANCRAGDELLNWAGQVENPPPAFTQDERLMAIPGNNAILVTDLVDRTKLPDLAGHAGATTSAQLWDLAFSPDGAHIAAASMFVRVWDVESGAHVTLASDLGPVTAMAWSLDSRYLATGGTDGTVRIWDVARRRVVASIPTGAVGVEDLAFTRDGSRLAVATDDGTVSLNIVDLQALIELARDRVARGFTDEECRRYLHVPSCPIT